MLDHQVQLNASLSAQNNASVLVSFVVLVCWCDSFNCKKKEQEGTTKWLVLVFGMQETSAQLACELDNQTNKTTIWKSRSPDIQAELALATDSCATCWCCWTKIEANMRK